MVVFVFLFGSRPLYTSLRYWGPAVPLYTLVSSTEKKNGVDEYGNQRQENPLDIDQAGFRSDAYIEKVLKECSLNELYKQEGRVKKGEGEGGRERE